MATPRASCWAATSVDGPCGKYDGPALPHCEGCARYPVKPIQDVSFAGVWEALAKVETDYLLQRQEVLRKIGEMTERMSADATKVKP